MLLSYDMTAAPRARRVQACRIVFGRRRISTGGQIRDEPGFIDRPGVVWIGQSVLVLPRRDADELAARLRGVGARVSMGPVDIGEATLERFRRP
jgi:hypothetical protein